MKKKSNIKISYFKNDTDFIYLIYISYYNIKIILEFFFFFF